MKLKLVKIASMLAALSFAASAFASQTIDSTGTSIGTQAFKTSNNVTIKVGSQAGDPTATPPTMGGFSAIANHASGDRIFGTNSLEPKIFWKSKDTTFNMSIAVSATAAAAGPTLVPAFVTDGWNSL